MTTTAIIYHPAYFKERVDTSPKHTVALLMREIEAAGGSLDVFVAITFYKGAFTITSKLPCKLVLDNDAFYIHYQHESKGVLDNVVHIARVNSDGRLNSGYRFSISVDCRMPVLAEMLYWSRHQGLERR